ncbi:MAG TPA: hypothetical protein VL426_04395 [Candidatus Binatia bacterium]|jgi:hypothetical protein|nr:hypothetical protein [Candidatus Binatia bacterium]
MTTRHTRAYLVTLALWTAYAALNFLTPTTENNALGLSPVSLALIRVSIVVPYLLAWLAGTYGALTLFDAAKSMPEKEDRSAFRQIAMGILILLGGVIVTSFVSGIRSYMMPSGRDVSSFVIVINYLYVFVPLAGFFYIFNGAGRLRGAPGTELSAAWAICGTALLLLFSALYVWLIFTNPTRQTSSDPKIAPSYFLPDAAIVLTIVIPFLATCVLALLAILRLLRYYRGVTGFLYKRSSLHLMYGLLGVITGSLLLQALLSLGSGRLLGLGLGPLLLVIYVFLIVQTLGYVFVALGARKLAAVERVMAKYEKPAS